MADENQHTRGLSGSGQGVPIPLPKSPTYIRGLDEVLEGGLPAGQTTVISGGPGSGKTILGLEFLYRGALAGEPGIFVGFEESSETIRRNALTMGWDLGALEQQNKLFLLVSPVRPDTLLSGEFTLKGLLASVSGKVHEMGAKRIAIDALEVILRLFDTAQHVRSEVHTLNDWLKNAGLTALMTIRPRPGNRPSLYEEFFDSMADCVIQLDARVSDQISTRRLRVIKYRGSGFGRNEYPYVITESGLHTAPITKVELRHRALGEKISTGLESLDTLLEGGIRRGACVLFAGLPGTGKTILVSTFANAACLRGETVLYQGFEESEDAMVTNLLSAGLDLEPHRRSGRMVFLTGMPESMGAEEHLIRFTRRLDAVSPDHVIVDAISACERMGGKQAAFEYLMRLLNICKERGITSLLTNQTSGASDVMEISGNGISSMVDTVLFLAYVEGSGETYRMLQILKARGSAHSNRHHRYIINDQGFQLLEL
ncbi:MAG: circadian clock protein KaiC [Deltaproteobacteria bacterium]|nr:circadian clock protein KaiC [Deltaproteobacteria bacterium]MBW2015571.1 circadian clock protein KaiC [Deltaproteobacteria bacterium]MBW2127891.1 circadian clock protein KaiC [Deltaproteobacteria bacterium]MBW2305273.1 circadian clock protein KaiC [Deltaproteobacteria bacterium]